MLENPPLSKFITTCSAPKRSFYLFYFLLSLSLAQRSTAQVNAFNGNGAYLLNFAYYKGNEIEIDKILNSTDFEVINGKVPALGIKEEPIFLKFELKNESPYFFISGFVDNALLDQVDIYSIDVTPKLLVSSGERVSYHERNSEHPAVNFQFFIQPGSTAKFLMRVQSEDQLLVPIRIGTEKIVSSEQSRKELLYGIYLGIMMVMLVYNLFVYFTVKDRVYLYYTAYILTVGLTQLVVNGYAAKYFWPYLDYYSMILSGVIPALSGVATVIFSREFLQTAKFTPKIDKLLLFYMGLYILGIVFAIFGQLRYCFTIMDVGGVSALLLVYCAIVGIRGSYRPARFFLVAFSIFLAGVTLFALRNFGVIPFNDLSNYGLPAGSALEAVLLSFALADRINQFKKEKDDSQQKMIQVMSENQRLIEEQNVKLENMVHERTLDLENANVELSTTLQNLKLTQNQLVEAEKLASLGQMTAGIAHEINNPINFVSSNVVPLKRDVEDVLAMLNDFTAIENGADWEAKKDAISAKMKKLDIPYVRTEIHQLIQGIEEGSRRTAEIVKGLRIFSRVDRDTLVSADVNDCIHSTLVVMKSVTKGEVTIEKELYSGNHEIMCYPGKLNQVFMNLLSNAVSATRVEGRLSNDRLIKIRSLLEKDSVVIEVEDNGVGIEPAIIDKIFDPFFTTKPVGEGTGLGLSIVKGIIEEHRGRIEVQSEVNKGTKFIIHLPRFIV